MKMSEEKGKVLKALDEVQKGIGSVKKTKEGFNYNYADLSEVFNAIDTQLEKNGLVLIQAPTVDNTLVTTLYHQESEQWLEFSMKLLFQKDDMQALGSAITYARRYSLMTVFGIAPVDDDGEKTRGDSRVKTNQVQTKQYNDTKQAQVSAHVKESDYVIPFGKYKNSRLSEIESIDLNNYANYLVNSAKQSGKPLSKNAEDFVERVDHMAMTGEQKYTEADIPL